MIIRIHPEPFTTAQEIQSLFTFLFQYGFAAEGAWVKWARSLDFPAPNNSRFPALEDEVPDQVDLEVGFLDNSRGNTDRLLETMAAPMLLVGTNGLPDILDHICIPFEMGRHFQTEWLSEVMEKARPHPVRLLHCDHGLVANEVMKMAEWFHMDSVRESMKKWLSEDLERKLHDLIAAYPEAEVKADVGRMARAFEGEDPKNMLIMGSLTRGLHLRHRHHGLAYGALLQRTGASGFFIRR